MIVPKLGATNPYIKDLPYQKESQTNDALEWAILHDERVTLPFSDLPKEVQEKAKKAFAELGEKQGLSNEEPDFLLKLQLMNISVEFWYSCQVCKLPLSAVSEWDYHMTGKGRKWGCKVCGANWRAEADHSAMYYITYNDKRLAFFAPFPMSTKVEEARPDVYYGYQDWLM